jgi:hypothetical protein
LHYHGAVNRSVEVRNGNKIANLSRAAPPVEGPPCRAISSSWCTRHAACFPFGRLSTKWRSIPWNHDGQAIKNTGALYFSRRK